MFMDDLFEDAQRQLNVCNACRYCEGYCPVWPALELRRELTVTDLSHLSHLCHDCRDCFTACMYTAPHEFALNPPKVFSDVRERGYDAYAPPTLVPRRLRGRRAAAWWTLLAAVVVVALSLLTTGGRAFGGGHGSAYDLVSHWTLVALVGAPAVWSVAVLVRAALRFWKDHNGGRRGLLDLAAWRRTLGQAARLTHYAGGGEGCSYQGDEPSLLRRRLHHLVMYGFLLTFFATVAAGFQENVLGQPPPYGYLSVPVVSGLLGGVAATAGCVGFLVAHPRTDPGQQSDTTRRANRAFVLTLLVLMVSGIATTVLRSTVAFGPLLVVHLAAVVVAFAVAPYTRFVHGVFRLLALQKDTIERRRTAASD